jgi:hypothetical protein
VRQCDQIGSRHLGIKRILNLAEQKHFCYT